MGKKRKNRRGDAGAGKQIHIDKKKKGRRSTVVDIDHELKRAFSFHRTGNMERAEAGYQKVLEINPKHPDALHLLGNIASQKGEFETAVRLIRQAIEQFPSDIFYNNMGNALARLNRKEEAMDAYQDALRINPQSLEAINNLAANLKETGRAEEALRYFKRALQINPDAAQVYNNMGNALTDLGLIEAAVNCFRKATALKPDYAIAYNNMGSALKQREQYHEAIESYSLSVKADPQYAEAFNNLGETLADMGKPDEAVPFFRQAIELKPNFSLAVGNLLYAVIRNCDWEHLHRLNHLLDELTDKELRNGCRPPEDPFLNLVRHDSPELNYKVAAAWSLNAEKRAAGHSSSVFRYKDRCKGHKKLVIGYLSNNFHDHPMAHLISRLLAAHNRDAVKVICFSSGRDDGSEYRRRIMDGCDTFVDIRKLGHQEAAECIYGHDVDILVDLMGHTKGNRIEICAQRCAPIQVRYLGMAGTTGASFFDYLIADAVIVPNAHFPCYSEKIVHLPHCYQVNGPEQKGPNRLFRRKDVGLPEHGFVFCSFNQPYKIDPLIFETWLRILLAVPDSVLWLQGGNPKAEKNLKRFAGVHGIDSERMIFARRMQKADHLSRLALADLALDTRMVSGAATTSDALWAGVPVIALKGAHFSSRMSASILNAAGFPELAADSLDAYYAIAVELAKHPQALDLKKRKLIAGLSASPLFDTRRFAELLEAAFCRMWHNYCSGGEPEHFAIKDPNML